MNGRGAQLSAAVVLAVVLGCVVTPTNIVAPGHEGAPAAERFLLCPANLVLALPPEVEEGAPLLQREVMTYLQAHGREVEKIALFAARRLWKQAMAEAKEAEALESAPARFAEKLARTRDFQALVMPSLLVHTIRMSYSEGSWDGVKRKMGMLGAPSRGVGRDRNLLAEGIALGGVSGKVPVSSLHVVVFTRAGEKVFEGKGGLEFLHEIDLDVSSYRYELRLRGDLFRDRAVLREGVELAFTPYLPRLEP